MSKKVWIGITAGFLIASSITAKDWTQFRGSEGQGHATDSKLPLKWSHEENSESINIAWRKSIPGSGWSSPVLFQDNLYVTTAVQSDGSDSLSLRTLCLNASSGKLVWQKEIFAPTDKVNIHRKNSNASPTPLIVDDRVYVHFGHHGTACLDLDGSILWKNNNFSYPPVHGNGGSPVLVNNSLIFSCDGAKNPFVIALHKNTGKVLWKTARKTKVKKSFSFCTPLVINIDGKPQVISPGSGAVCAYDPDNGKELWRVRYGEGYSVVPRPIYGHGLLYIATGFDRATVMAIRPGGSGDVTDSHVEWVITKGAPKTPSLLLIEKELYMVSDSGIATCLDALTGKTHWQERIGGNYSASPIYSNGKIYCQSETGDGVIIAASKEFKKIATNPLNEKTLASYAADENALYIRSTSHLYKVREQ